jgi:ABC-type transport system substrate-binding protein
MLQKLRKKEFDACMLGWAADWKQDPFQLWHSSQADVPESSNAGAYRNPEVDKLIDELRVTLDQKKQVELYHKIHRIIFDDQPYTFLFADMQTAAYDARLQNIKHYRLRPAVDHREWTATSPRSFGK